MSSLICNSIHTLLYEQDTPPLPITLDEFDESCAVPFNEIIQSLFLGNELGAGRLLFKDDSLDDKKNALYERKITHILCCTSSSRTYFKDHFIYEFIPIADEETESLAPHLSKAYAFIEEGIASGGILVHCAAGSSRSASFVIGYLMQKFSLPYERVLHFVQHQRPCVKPNSGFETQLKKI